MLGRIFIAVLFVSILELWLLIKVTAATSIGFTLLAGLFTFLVGLSLIRGVGARAATKLQKSVQQGSAPDLAVAEGLLSVIAGVLLMVPGFLTDIIGALMLLPPFRQLLSKRLLRAIPVTGFQGMPGGMGFGFPGASTGTQAGNPFGGASPFGSREPEPQAPSVDVVSSAFDGGHFDPKKVKYSDGYVPPKPSTGPVILDAEIIDDGGKR